MTVEVKPTSTVTVSVKLTATVVTGYKPTKITVSILVVEEETLTVVPRKKEALNALSEKFAGLGVTVVVSRKKNAYVVGYGVYDNPPGSYFYGNGYFSDIYSSQIGININETKEMWSEMGVANDGSYTFLDASKGVSLTYEKMYMTTPENSIVYFAVNPFYVDGSQAKEAFDGASEILVDSGHIKEHGWIVSGVGYDMKDNVDTDGCEENDPACRIGLLSLLEDNPWFKNGELIKGYHKAIKTGKVRLFYALNDDQTKRASELETLGVGMVAGALKNIA